MTDPQFDAGFTTRQYVVLDAVGGLAAFTGHDTNPFAAHLDASDTRFSVGIAGNCLTGADVLDGAARGFGDAAACDLEERLVNALVAASTDALGDRAPRFRSCPTLLRTPHRAARLAADAPWLPPATAARPRSGPGVGGSPCSRDVSGSIVQSLPDLAENVQPE